MHRAAACAGSQAIAKESACAIIVSSTYQVWTFVYLLMYKNTFVYANYSLIGFLHNSSLKPRPPMRTGTTRATTTGAHRRVADTLEM